MSGDVVNLRLARKNKARSEAEKLAADNRVKFGMTKHEKTLAVKNKAIDARTLDGKKRDT